MKTFLCITALLLATGCVSTAQLAPEAQGSLADDTADETPSLAEDPDEDFSPRQLAAIAQAALLANGQPGECEVGYTPRELEEPEPPKPRKAIARPELVSKKNRPQLFVLPTSREK